MKHLHQHEDLGGNVGVDGRVAHILLDPVIRKLAGDLVVREPLAIEALQLTQRERVLVAL
jgi:hypothetical protein